MFRVQAASQGAGQILPVNSGKLLVACNCSIAFFQSPLKLNRSSQVSDYLVGNHYYKKGPRNPYIEMLEFLLLLLSKVRKSLAQSLIHK